jgi:hypothetical protein
MLAQDFQAYFCRHILLPAPGIRKSKRAQTSSFWRALLWYADFAGSFIDLLSGIGAAFEGRLFLFVALEAIEDE